MDTHPTHDRAVDDWDNDTDQPAAGSSAPLISIAGFEGPLDWMLEMAKNGRIDLATISILAMATAFCDAMDQVIADRRPQAAPISRWADWLIMAASLTVLRSRLMLPRDAAEEKKALDDAAELRRRLIERQQIRDAADWLEARPQLGRDVFVRGATTEDVPVTRTATLQDLMLGCLAAMRTEKDQTIYVPRLPPFWRIHDAVQRVREMTSASNVEIDMIALIPPITAGDAAELRKRPAIASTLIASLELTREGVATVRQDQPFQTIMIGSADRPT